MLETAGQEVSEPSEASAEPPIPEPPLPSGVPAIVLGSGISALGALRALARRGIPTYVADPGTPLLRRSRWFRPVPGAGSAPHPSDLREWLDGLTLDGAVLLPASDAWARAVADRKERSPFRSSCPSPRVLEVLVDKAVFARRLRELGVPHPRTYALDTIEDLERVPEEVFEQAFLKPRDSQSFYQAFGVKAFMVPSRRAARRRLSRLLPEGYGMMLQEYVPGPPTHHYFVDGFVDARHEVRALFARQRLRMHPPRFGNSTYMKSVEPEAARGAIDSLERLLPRLGYRGMFSAEFKLDPRDGTFRILEVNARAWWYVDFAARCGVDVCSMAYADALGRPVPRVDSYRVGRTLVYPYSDYFALRDGRGEDGAAFGGYGSWIGALQPVFDPADPWPGLAGLLEVIGGKARNVLAGLTGRRPKASREQTRRQ